VSVLRALSGGFLGPSAQARRIRRILHLAGHPLRPGWPGPGDAVIAWGHSPTAGRAEWLAAKTGAPLWRVEDAWVRSIHPGRMGREAPMGLLLDRAGLHYDPGQISDLEALLARHPLDETPLLDRAKLAMARLQALHLSKYNAFDPGLEPPKPGYVLVIDQVRGDASLRHGGPKGFAAQALFDEMLDAACDENPGARILIRSHPETTGGARMGHYQAHHAHGRAVFCDAALSPWALLEGAVAVYTVSSQLGAEAILAGHRPRVFGQPFYAGWGLSRDQSPLPRRNRRLTRAQFFAAAWLLYPLWFDPLRDRLCPFEDVLDHMEAQVRAHRMDHAGHVAIGMRLWKRGHMQAMFGREKPLRFARDLAAAEPIARVQGRGLLGWGAALPPGTTGLRIEDAFLRSTGLGAALVPPVSLGVDDLGLHYDPAHPSRLEALIMAPLPPGGAERAARLRARILDAGLTKYNLRGLDPATRAAVEGLRARGRVILVPGQVEDDASLRLGAPGLGNRALLERARAENPDAAILYKPHPDVVAGLRPGAVEGLETLADLVVEQADPAQLLGLVDEVWTLTSGLGFEALLRGVRVVCLGLPFYAGWGLTRDLTEPPARRLGHRPGLDALTYAALIAWPRYMDPLTGQPCSPELAVERLAAGQAARGGAALRLLAKLQGAFATQAWLWRR